MQKEDTLPSKLVEVYDLKKQLANFVCKGPGSKYLRHRQPPSLGHNCSVLPLQPRSSHRHFLCYSYCAVVPTNFIETGGGPDLAYRPWLANPDLKKQINYRILNQKILSRITVKDKRFSCKSLPVSFHRFTDLFYKMCADNKKKL